MKPIPIADLMRGLHLSLPHLSPYDLQVIRKVIEDDRYNNNLIGAINRTKNQESKAE